MFFASTYCLLIFAFLYKNCYTNKVFLAQIHGLLFFLYYCEKHHTNENVSGASFFLFLFVYYCKNYHTNENICGANLLLVAFCLLFQKVSDEWKYFKQKFSACSSLFLIVKGIIWMKRVLGQIYCLSFLLIILKSIIRIKNFLRMKIFLGQIYCSFLFV